MIAAIQVIKQVKEASGTLEKQDILSRNFYVEGLKDILKFIYDPYQKTGISQAKLAKAMKVTPSAQEYDFMQMINYFKTHKTGSDNDLRIVSMFLYTVSLKYPREPFALELAKALVTQDLQIGVSVKTLNKVFGDDFIPKTGCMLGTPYEDVPADRIKWPCIVTEKLDGIRRILIKENGVCRLFSRSGHEDEGLIEIEEEAFYLPDNYVYDGELLAEGEYPNSIALRQATNSIANRKGVRRGVTFNIFDMIPVSEFRAGKSDFIAVDRKIVLGATLGDQSILHLHANWANILQAFSIHRVLPHIKAVPILGYANSFDEVSEIVSEIWNNGGEGVMLNTYCGLYEIKRTKELLKVKRVEEHVLPIVDVIEGFGKYEGMMGSVIVSYKGQDVGVGSGFTDAERVSIWEGRDLVIGMLIEIETFGESKNANGTVSLNCAIFKRFVPRKPGGI